MTDLKRLFDLIPFQSTVFPRKDCISDKKDGKWITYSTEEVQSIIDRFSLGLLKLGVNPGDKLAIISTNRVEWNFVDLGILQAGCIDVPVYPNIGLTQYEYILNFSGVKYVFVANEDLYSKINSIKSKISSLIDIYTLDKLEGKKHWKEILELADESLRERLNKIRDNVKSDDLATIIFTSGTTGTPKGVMLSHNNILSNVISLTQIMPINNTHRVISFLPICHIFERTVVYYYMKIGAAIYYAESIDKVGDNLKEIKPNYFTTVPRLLEKIYDKIMDKGRDLKWPKRAIFGWAVNLANHYHPQGKTNLFYNLRLWAARKIVFSKWLEALGGEVKGIISGAAALQPRLGRIFTAAGVNVIEGYGLTETSPVITCNRFEDYYVGTVGFTIPGVEVKIADTGEILAKGPNVMKGYYNNPEATKESIDEEGWFHTGDIGIMVNDKYLKITDRLKEIFKTSGGKFIAPLPIENKMKESLFIRNIMVIGENQKFCAALIVPEFDFIKKWCEKKSVKDYIDKGAVLSEVVKERIWKEIQHYNKRFDHIQQVKKFELVDNDWTVDSGELTPTLKLKRRIILKSNQKLIDNIYSEPSNKN
ncbi:MAG: long-chain fatty acid--CoA ligase [Bacteroidetes bacterium]|nr:long-chain fatty acid--CoA ligase [Bacteroidota bacterium]MBU1680138.1 long-chain fatty acid--CoA ligase [Bacteroidota bacterium]MBU2506831.1 long-chain fatty acid--CoA ligase [Bacteroidota bacterium]